MFQVKVGMEDLGEFPKFIDAFKLFYSKVLEEVKRGASLQWLETSNFLVYQGEGFVQPMDFYDARDFAYTIGLLAGEGEIQDGVEEPATETIEATYAGVAKEYLKSQLRELSSATEAALSALG
jgi:hypothetical protein